MRCPPQCDIELMPQEKILDLEPLPRLDQVGDKDSKQMEDCEYSSVTCLRGSPWNDRFGPRLCGKGSV